MMVFSHPLFSLKYKYLFFYYAKLPYHSKEFLTTTPVRNYGPIGTWSGGPLHIK